MQHLLRDVLNYFRLPFTQQQIVALTNFVRLLNKWNKAYNLIGTQDSDKVIPLHIADSLAVCEYLRGTRIIDIGTGAGLPGIPLAIMQPQREFVLLDSNGKKITFIKQIIAELNLQNATAVQARAEAFTVENCFNSVLTRAFASICDMLKVTQHLACVDGCFLAMKGMQPRTEIQTLPDDFILDVVHALDVPGIDAARCLVVIKHKNDERKR